MWQCSMPSFRLLALGGPLVLAAQSFRSSQFASISSSRVVGRLVRQWSSSIRHTSYMDSQPTNHALSVRWLRSPLHLRVGSDMPAAVTRELFSMRSISYLLGMWPAATSTNNPFRHCCSVVESVHFSRKLRFTAIWLWSHPPAERRHPYAVCKGESFIGTFMLVWRGGGMTKRN